MQLIDFVLGLSNAGKVGLLIAVVLIVRAELKSWRANRAALDGNR
jgi:hypothetical protein